MRILRPVWSLTVLITGTEYRFKTWERRMRRVRRRRRLVTETENWTALKVLRQCLFVHLAFCTRHWTHAVSLTMACLLILSRKIICLHCKNHNEIHKYTLYRFYIFSLLSGRVFYVLSKLTRKTVWYKITEVSEEPISIWLQGRKNGRARLLSNLLMDAQDYLATY